MTDIKWYCGIAINFVRCGACIMVKFYKALICQKYVVKRLQVNDAFKPTEPPCKGLIY